MKTRLATRSRKISLLCGLLLSLNAPRLLRAEPTPADVSAFNLYARAVESRLALQHRSAGTFINLSTSDPSHAALKLRQGEPMIEQLTPSSAVVPYGALLHHWRGTAFAPGAKADDFERLMRNFNSYPQHFSPQVLQARVISQDDRHLQATIRVRQHHVITVVMDTTYDITFGELDLQHGYSISRSTRIDEIDSPGTRSERPLKSQEEHGFLWRQNTYWSYEECDGGLYLQIESVSLTRAIPSGLGWAIRPYIESIPRESLEFTLHSACNALRR